MMAEIWSRRHLLAAFARRDLTTRYRGSVAGWGWSLAQPIAMLVIFGTVFGVLFGVQAPPMGGGHGSSYAAFLFTGLVTWNLMTGLMDSSMTQLMVSGELLRKVAFPGWAPVLGGSVVQLLQVALEVVVLLAMLALLGNVGWTWLLALPVLVAAACLGQGVGLILALANARHGDVRHATTAVLTLLYFVTPVLYPVTMVEDVGGPLAWVVLANPLGWYVVAMHDVLYSLAVPPAWLLAILLLAGPATLWLGFRYFTTHDRDLAEYAG